MTREQILDDDDLDEAIAKFEAWQAEQRLIVEGRDTDFAVARAIGMPLATEEELEHWRKYMATLQRNPWDQRPGTELPEACYLASVDRYCPQPASADFQPDLGCRIQSRRSLAEAVGVRPVHHRPDPDP
jgi:hypothetical protein